MSGIIYDAAGFSYNCLVLQLFVVIMFIINTICYFLPTHRDDYEAIPDTPTSQYSNIDRRDSVFPELPADVIRSSRSNPQPARRPKIRKYSTSSSVYERSVF